MDDVLTLSKLDSNLLIITPDQVKPVAIVQKALKMFETEVYRNDIETELLIGSSYQELDIDTVLLDGSRLSQVLINLLTNAIKFTQQQSQRMIRIHLGASKTRPAVGHNDTPYIPQRGNCPDRTVAPEWGCGGDLFLKFAVEDTGRGLSEDEMKTLFLRFSQASPKTYGQYGGSGLGLFISRELTELQGGQIGVSTGGTSKGSTFTFYIKAKTFIPPDGPPPKSRSSNGMSGTAAAQKPKVSAKRKDDTRQHSIDLNGNEIPQDEPPTKVLKSPSLPTALNILVVEDNLINQKVTAQQLRREGRTVYVANQGVEALSFLACTQFAARNPNCAPSEPKSSSMTTTTTPTTPLTNRPDSLAQLDVILMDCEMPVMDGLTCVRRIREMQRSGEITGHVPVIAVTANARTEQIAHAMEQGMVRVANLHHLARKEADR